MIEPQGYNEMTDWVNNGGTRNVRLVRHVGLLLGLLFVVVPVFALGTDTTPVVPLGVVGVLYAGSIAIRREIEVGATAAVFVFAVMSASVPFAGGPYGIEFELWLYDLPLVAALAVLAFQQQKLRLRWSVYVLLVLIALVSWTFLSAIVGNGVSIAAAMTFAVDHVRYLLLFAFGVLATMRFRPRTLVFALSATTAANILYATAEMLRQSSFGLTTLGDLPQTYGLDPLHVGPVVLGTGLYPGGFAGSSRSLLAIVLLLTPAGAHFLFRGSVWHRLVGAVLTIGSVLLTAISFSDAAKGVLPLVACLAVALVAYNWTDSRWTIPTKAVFAVGALGMAVGTVGFYIIVRLGVLSLDNIAIRASQYSAALTALNAHPVFGVGGYNFVLVAERYGMETPIEIHSTLLAYLAEVGLPGAGLFTAAVVLVLFAGLQRVLRERDETSTAYGMLLVGMVGFHVYSLVTLTYNRPWVYSVLWISAGVVVQASHRYTDTSNDAGVESNQG